MLLAVPVRDVDDRCPGVLRPFAAADGAIVRLRVAGGRVSSHDLVTVCDLAERFGQPFVQLTSRGNLQLRGLDEPLPGAFVDAVAALGMLPSATHERVRNIVAGPDASLDSLVQQLDSAIVDTPSLASLSGRWIFALAAGDETLPAVPADVAFALGADDDGSRAGEMRVDQMRAGEVRVGGRSFACAAHQAAATLVAVAEDFVATTQHDDGRFWNVTDLPDDHPFFARLDERVRAAAMSAADMPRAETRPATGTAATTSKSRLEVHLPLGLLDAPAARALDEVTQDVVVTPERSIVVRTLRDGADLPTATRHLRGAGFVTEPGSARARFSACVGAPYCRRTDVSTLDLTRAAARIFDDGNWCDTALDDSRIGSVIAASTPEHASADDRRATVSAAPRVHVVGCERACGRPAGEHHLVVAPHNLTDILDPNGRS